MLRQALYTLERQVGKRAFSQLACRVLSNSDTGNVNTTVHLKNNILKSPKLNWPPVTLYVCGSKTLFSTFVPEKYQHFYTLESWSHEVHPFGKLSVRGPFNVHIEPLDPYKYPEMNKAFVTVYADKEKGKEMLDVAVWNRLVRYHVNLTNNKKHLDISGEITSEGHEQFPRGIFPLECIIQVPIKFGVDLELLEEGNAYVSHLESTSVKVVSNMGDCIVNNVKAGSISVHSLGGSINCRKAIQGNIDLKTGMKGTITADKIQGMHIKAQTENGHLQVKSIYGDSAVFWSNKGTVHLGSCHGDISVDVYNGNICIESLDGNLSARIEDSGCVEAHLVRHEKVDIKVRQGDITLKLADTAHTGLQLTGDDVSVDNSFQHSDLAEGVDKHRVKFTGCLGSPVCLEDDRTSHVEAETKQGRIEVQCRDWFSAIHYNRMWET